MNQAILHNIIIIEFIVQQLDVPELCIHLLPHKWAKYWTVSMQLRRHSKKVIRYSFTNYPYYYTLVALRALHIARYHNTWHLLCICGNYHDWGNPLSTWRTYMLASSCSLVSQKAWLASTSWYQHRCTGFCPLLWMYSARPCSHNKGNIAISITLLFAHQLPMLMYT